VNADGIAAGPIHVAPGTGVLLRTPGALLFLTTADDRAASLITAFLDATESGAVEAVTEAATASRFDVPPFVLLGWSEPAAGDHLHVVALGAVEVRTDHPSLPMVSGAGSGSWVERRLRLDGSTVVVEVGPAADAASDLQLGRLAADGFTAEFRGGARPAATTTDRPARPAAQPAVHGSMGATPEVDLGASEPAPPPAAAPAAQPTSIATAADPTGPIGGDRLAALRAAMGATSAEPPSTATAPAPTSPVATSAPTAPVVDDEITLAPDDPPPTVPEPDRSSIPDPAVAGPDDAAPLISVVRCGRGHVNPVHVSVCRTCGDLLPIGAQPETIRQPPVALLDAGEETVPIDRTLVVGRRPDVDAAQAPDRARTIVIEGDGSVSRTHLRVDVEDWSLTVTDCGSRSGTAIVVRPGEEPRILEPWVSYELPVGARLFLGGPTSVVIRPIDTGRGRRG
jgi:hypothetical protein